MEILDNQQKFRPLIEQAIKNFGWAPEHNMEWFLVNAETSEKPVYSHWPDGSGLMTLKADREWYTFSEPLAPRELAASRIREFTETVFNEYLTEEVIIETEESVKSEIEKSIPRVFSVEPADCTLIWPVVNLESLPGDLSGGGLKGLRNIRSRFYREYSIEVGEASEANKQDFYNIINTWSKNRTSKDEVWPQTYINLVNNNFLGTQRAAIFVINNKPVGFVAGWEIPNKPGYFYNGVVIHDYSFRDLGLFMYVENILEVKKLGYKYFDLGGVEEGGPLEFKRRFKPEYEYQTQIFSVAKK